MEEILIRPMSPDEAPAVLALMRELASSARMEAHITTTAEQLAAACFSEPVHCHVLLVEVDGGIAGYAFCLEQYDSWSGSRYLQLDDLYLRPSVRGRGVGRKLMGAIARLALARDRWVKWEVLPTNESAILFYDGLGAHRYERTMYAWQEAAMRQFLES